MAKSKIEEFTPEEIKLAEFAKAISHPARIRILHVLNELNICMTGEIVDLLPLSQSTVSQHLAELKRVGLIKGEIEGPKTCYCIDKNNFQLAEKSLGSFLNKVCNC